MICQEVGGLRMNGTKKVYRLWVGKLMCCYSEKFHQTKYGKTYIGCTMCDRWLKLSNFVEDVPKIDGYDEERFLNGELELDKDIKSDGTKKIYCLEECTFVTHEVNQRQANKTRDYSDMQGENNPMYGKQHSEETRIKISEAIKGENNPMHGKFGSECPNSKKVAQYDKNTLELIKIWDSMRDVKLELGIGHISECCRGKRKSAGGFIWKYAEDE